MENVTLSITIERLLDPADADRLQALQDERADHDSERTGEEIELDIDDILSQYLDTSDINDIVKYETI